jgi:hypothetical protein
MVFTGNHFTVEHSKQVNDLTRVDYGTLSFSKFIMGVTFPAIAHAIPD